MSRALAEVAAAVDPDLVHAHWLPEFGWMAAREHLSPLVCSAWGSDVFGVRGIGRRRSRLALDAAQLVLADSAHLARATRELGRGVRVEVARWGLDLDSYSPGDTAAARQVLNLPETPVVASVRGFDPLYNPNLLLEAFALIRKRHSGVQFLLKHRHAHAPAEIEERMERLGLRESVTVIGNVTPERMVDIYRAADVVISLASSDSSPRSVWEALGCGRPVVVSDLAWARDELQDGTHALIVSIDAGAVADAVVRVLDDRALAHRLGAQGRALAAANLDPVACAARIDALYRSVVGRR